MPAAGAVALASAAMPAPSSALEAAQLECVRLTAELEAVQQADDSEFGRLLDIISAPLAPPAPLPRDARVCMTPNRPRLLPEQRQSWHEAQKGQTETRWALNECTCCIELNLGVHLGVGGQDTACKLRLLSRPQSGLRWTVFTLCPACLITGEQRVALAELQLQQQQQLIEGPQAAVSAGALQAAPGAPLPLLLLPPPELQRDAGQLGAEPAHLADSAARSGPPTAAAPDVHPRAPAAMSGTQDAGAASQRDAAATTAAAVPNSAVRTPPQHSAAVAACGATAEAAHGVRADPQQRLALRGGPLPLTEAHSVGPGGHALGGVDGAQMAAMLAALAPLAAVAPQLVELVRSTAPTAGARPGAAQMRRCLVIHVLRPAWQLVLEHRGKSGWFLVRDVWGRRPHAHAHFCK